MTSPRFQFAKESAAQIVDHLGGFKGHRLVSSVSIFIFFSLFFPSLGAQVKVNMRLLHTSARLFQKPDNARLSRLSAAVTHSVCVCAHVWKKKSLFALKSGTHTYTQDIGVVDVWTLKWSAAV